MKVRRAAVEFTAVRYEPGSPLVCADTHTSPGKGIGKPPPGIVHAHYPAGWYKVTAYLEAGWKEVKEGDWLLVDAEGLVHPIRADNFETYEPCE